MAYVLSSKDESLKSAMYHPFSKAALDVSGWVF